MTRRVEAVQDDKDAQFQVGVDYAIEQCRQLKSAGVPGIHFYVLNRSEAAAEVLSNINRPA